MVLEVDGANECASQRGYDSIARGSWSREDTQCSTIPDETERSEVGEPHVGIGRFRSKVGPPWVYRGVHNRTVLPDVYLRARPEIQDLVGSGRTEDYVVRHTKVHFATHVARASAAPDEPQSDNPVPVESRGNTAGPISDRDWVEERLRFNDESGAVGRHRKECHPTNELCFNGLHLTTQ